MNPMQAHNLEVLCECFPHEPREKLLRDLEKNVRRARRYEWWDGYELKVKTRECRMRLSRLVREGLKNFQKDPYRQTAQVASILCLSFNLMVENSSAVNS